VQPQRANFQDGWFAMSRIFQSLIQSSLGGGYFKNFEAVVVEGNDLWHWFRDNSKDGTPWSHGQRIVDGRVAYPGSIIQSDFDGNFEVVVPCAAAGGGVELIHFFHENADVASPWRQGQRITEAGRMVVGAASIIQSDFGLPDHGNFEVVVPILGDDGRAELRHYFHNNGDVNAPWVKAQVINPPDHTVLGPACLIQSDFGAPNGNFEVAAWVRLPDGRSVLHHYWRTNGDTTSPWMPGQIIAEGVRGPGVIIQSSIGNAPNKNFEVVVPVDASGGGTQLRHFFRWNTNVTDPWLAAQVISELLPPGGAGCIIESSFPGGGLRNFEVLVDECTQSLTAYWHPNEDPSLYWIRHKALFMEPPAASVQTTRRICQVTGEYDRSEWDGTGSPRAAFNRTETAVGLRGTDLGSSFVHNGKIYFLFGDTWRVGVPHNDLDAIAYSSDDDASGGLRLTFLPSPPICNGINQAGFEVPLDGFSYGGAMHVFFSTDHRHVEGGDLMMRSVLATSQDHGRSFDPLVTFSTGKFINVSVEVDQLSREHAQMLGWDEGTDVLWIWASGRYRSSPPYLAVAHLKRLLGVLQDNRERDRISIAKLNTETGPIKYFIGNVEAPRWSQFEHEACPLFCCSEIGELCCRWNPYLDRFVLTYNGADNPGGIVMRTARRPWGGWSSPIVIFDAWWDKSPAEPRGRGYGRFMHVAWNFAQLDHAHDDMWLSGPRVNEWGGVYGPYQIAPLTKGVRGVRSSLYWLMSTWNPYQVMLMTTDIDARQIG
jgi:hypothetical protein